MVIGPFVGNPGEFQIQGFAWALPRLGAMNLVKTYDVGCRQFKLSLSPSFNNSLPLLEIEFWLVVSNIVLGIIYETNPWNTPIIP